MNVQREGLRQLKFFPPLPELILGDLHCVNRMDFDYLRFMGI